MEFARDATVLLVALALVVIIVGKLLIEPSPVLFFLFYGVAATFSVLMMFVVSSIAYVDPGIKAMNAKQSPGKKMPFVSIVLSVFNEEEIIERCVNSILASTYRKREIIIINDASTDRTMDSLRKFERFPEVRIIDLKKNVGKKKAIAKGLEVANGELFVFTDSDCVLAEDAIERIVGIFANDPDVGAVSGHARALNSEENLITRIQDSWYEGQFAIKKAFESVFGSVTCVSGPLAVFRRSAIFNYIPAWAEDSFLGNEFRFATDRTLTAFAIGGKSIGDRMKAKHSESFFVKSEKYPSRDWKSLYCKSAKVWTNIPNTFKKFVMQNIRWKKSFFRNIFLTGSFYWKKPLPVAFKYYMNVLFVFIGPVIVLRHMILLPLSGDYLSGVLYFIGISFVGLAYGLAIKVGDAEEKNVWVYRPLMSLLSTMLLSWLIVYSLLTIRKNTWHRG